MYENLKGEKCIGLCVKLTYNKETGEAPKFVVNNYIKGFRCYSKELRECLCNN